MDVSAAARLRAWVAGISLAIAAVLVVLWNGDRRMLDPTDLSWIRIDDPFAHIMGWEQFRASPLLQYPIGKNEGYGLEQSSSLVYSDSIPAAALILRPLSSVLPHPFQYLGWWAVLSVALQGYWGARLIRLRSVRTGHAVVGAAFFMVAPTLLNRIGMHTALTSQWMILCALWLYFSSRELQARRWLLLLLFAVSVHAYLFAMVGGIWVAHVATCRIARTLGWRALWQVAGMVAAVTAWMHCLGYFIIGRGTAVGGVDVSRFDLVNFIAGISWSSLPTVFYGNHDLYAWDGYAYLGAGLIALLGASLLASLAGMIVRRARRRATTEAAAPAAPRVAISWIPLIVGACGFLLYAASNKVLLDGHQIISYRWPWFIRWLTLVFRGGGRLIWPTYYVLVLSILWFAIRTWPPRVLTAILGGCLVLQVFDLHGGTALMRAGNGGPAPGLIKPLHDPVWATIAARYHKLVSVPTLYGQPDRHTLTWFAARHGIATNIGYFGRIDSERQDRGARRTFDAMVSGVYDPETTYCFPDAKIWNVARQTASPHDLAVIADGHHLLLPGAGPAGTQEPVGGVTAPPLDTPLDLDGFMLDGWSWREAWGTWSNARFASLILPVPPGHRGKLRVAIRWMGAAGRNGKLRIQIAFDHSEFQVDLKGDHKPQEDVFEVVPTRDWIGVWIQISPPVAGEAAGLRALGLIAIRLSDPNTPAGVAGPPAPDGTQP